MRTGPFTDPPSIRPQTIFPKSFYVDCGGVKGGEDVRILLHVLDRESENGNGP